MKNDVPVIGEALNRAARLLRRLADARLEPFGLSSGHLPVVTALMEEDGLTQKALVARAAIEQPTMVATLARMERDGIVERRPDPADRRSARFSLAASTKARLPEIRAAIASLNAEAVAGLTDRDKEALGRALLLVSRCVEAALRDS